MARTITNEEQKRFEQFTKELAKLSKKYGIVLQVTGGVYIEKDGDIKSIVYTDDASSGDLNSEVEYNS